MFVAVVHKQILFRKTAYPIFGIFIDHARVVLLIAVQFAAQRLDVQDKAFAVGQTLAAEKQSLHAFDLRQLARQRHGVGRFAEKVHPHTIAAFFRRRHMVRQHNGCFAAAQRFDDLFDALNAGRRSLTLAAHAPCLHHRIKNLDFRRLVHRRQRKRQLLADVAARQIIAADVRRDKQQTFARAQGRLNMFPTIDADKQVFNFLRPSEKRHRQFQAAFCRFTENFFHRLVRRVQSGKFHVFEYPPAIFRQQAETQTTEQVA